MVVEPKDFNKRGKVKNKREYFRLSERMRIEVRMIKELTDEITGEKKFEKVGKAAEHITNDISAGGLQFFSRFHFRENMLVEITLNFRETDPHFDPITVTGKIIRAEAIEHSQSLNICIKYENIDSKDRSHIERYIFVRQREMIAEKRIGFL
ncbi:MAG: PilZ domain-containing protein [Nitrospirae bacterium]|nr:PilZ domain-containing protein [Nitrospirota bacterium]